MTYQPQKKNSRKHSKEPNLNGKHLNFAPGDWFGVPACRSFAARLQTWSLATPMIQHIPLKKLALLQQLSTSSTCHMLLFSRSPVSTARKTIKVASPVTLCSSWISRCVCRGLSPCVCIKYNETLCCELYITASYTTRVKSNSRIWFVPVKLSKHSCYANTLSWNALVVSTR